MGRRFESSQCQMIYDEWFWYQAERNKDFLLGTSKYSHQGLKRFFEDGLSVNSVKEEDGNGFMVIRQYRVLKPSSTSCS